MSSMSTGLKSKLTISPCTVNKSGVITADTSNAFEAMINPSGYNHKFFVKYTSNEVLGAPATEKKYNASSPEKITLNELVLDGTGVVTLSGLTDVKDQVAQLQAVIYTYEGEKHEPPIVQVQWGGNLLFYGRVESFTVNYTLFKPNGDPLRAKIDLTFVEYKSTQEISKEANQSSPDLTHIVEVKAGDSLPLLCYRIYQDCSYYKEVAKINNIINFRDLQPGAKLRFPPLA
jgi:nucleoid-associated protein YgaU